MPPPAPKSTPSGPAVTPLPNPLDAPKSEIASPNASATAPTTADTGTPNSDSGANAAVTLEPPTAATAMPVAPTAPTTTASAPVADSPLLLTFTGTSWAQVKDASGAIIASQTSTTGAALPVSGRLPFTVVIGNADHVRAQFRGQSVDLAPHTVHNVARLLLR
jgi:cytoskeleton protein RodZ